MKLQQQLLIRIDPDRSGCIRMGSCCLLLMLVLGGARVQAQQKLDPVKVSAEAPPDYRSVGLRGFEERRLKGSGKYLSEKELRAADNRTLPNVLTKLGGIRLLNAFSNTYVVSSRSSGGGGRAALQGGGNRQCFVAVYQDGMRLYSGNAGEQPIDFQRLQVNQYAGIEFYPGGASLPQQFNQTKGSDCGTLLLWTREK
jgi:hypothetical protein